MIKLGVPNIYRFQTGTLKFHIIYYLILDGTLFEHSVNHAADLESILILFNIFFQ